MLILARHRSAGFCPVATSCVAPKPPKGMAGLCPSNEGDRRSVDKLETMLVVVAFYYFVCSLVALRHFSRRAVILTVLVVIAVNSLGGWVWQWHR